MKASILMLGALLVLVFLTGFIAGLCPIKPFQGNPAIPIMIGFSVVLCGLSGFVIGLIFQLSK